MNLRDRLSLQYTRLLAATPEGRAHVLNQVADAESSGEAQIFDQALARVDDPHLARMIEKHRGDEIRHAELFRARLADTGVDPGPVPENLKMMDRLDRKLGGFLGKPITDSRGVMEAYVVLQVVEERALHQFALIAQAFEATDPQTSRVFEEVGRDEERHLKYCHAISRRYAPDEATRVATLREYRQIEAECFRDNSAANMDYTLEHKFVANAFRRTAWRLVGALGQLATGLPMTAFADETGSEFAVAQTA